MGDSSYFAAQDDSKSKTWNRVRGKISALKKEHLPRHESDISDFLRPNSVSPEPLPHAQLAPRLDIKAAQNPLQSGHQVPFFPGHPRATVPDTDYPFEKYRPIKAPRKGDLRVGFARAQPELIGEGGDDAEDAPIAVSSNRPAAATHRGLSQTSMAQQDPYHAERESSEYPDIRRPLRRTPTGLEEASMTQQDSDDENFDHEDPVRRNSDSSSEYPPPPDLTTAAPAHPSGTYTSHTLESHLQESSLSGQRLPNHADPGNKRLSMAQPTQQVQSADALARSKTLPTKGLRRMREDEGLTHARAVRKSWQLQAESDVQRPSSSRSSQKLSPPPSRGQLDRQYPGKEHDRTPSQASQRSTSPQGPYQQQIHRNAIPREANWPTSNSAPLKPAVSASTYSELPSRSRPSVPPQSQNLDVMPPPYQNIPPPSGYQGPPEDQIPANLKPLSHRSRASFTNFDNRSSGEPDYRFDSDYALRNLEESSSGAFAVFELAEDKGRSEISLQDWLRAAVWWFLRGRSQLKVATKSPSTSYTEPTAAHDRNETMSAQCHLDLAKALWILCRVLPEREEFKSAGSSATEGFQSGQVYDIVLQALRSLATSLHKRHLIPTQQLLMQGLDSRIWVPPSPKQFLPDWQWTLSGRIFRAPDDPPPNVDALSALPIGDTDTTSYIGRAFAKVGITSGEGSPQHEPFPCLLSVICEKPRMDLRLLVSSQNPTVHITVQGSSAYGVHWEHVRWDTEYSMLRIKLPNKIRLYAYFTASDFQFLQSQCHSVQDKTTSLKPQSNEMTLQTFALTTFQYNDTLQPNAFPPERQKSAVAAVFETLESDANNRSKRLHAGYRIAIAPGNPSLPPINLELGHQELFEYAFDPVHPDMQVRINEMGRCRRGLLGFETFQQREMFRDFLSGTVLGPGDKVSIRLPARATGFSFTDGPGQRPSVTLKWSSLQLIEGSESEPESGSVKSASNRNPHNLRLMMYDEIGSLLTRLSSSVGASKVRLEAEMPTAVKMLHAPNTHITTVTAGPDLDHVSTMSEVMGYMNNPERATVQTLMFETMQDVHAFETAISGYRVIFDGRSVNFTIPRRRMLVPITQPWVASGARVQVIEREGFMRLVAFFEGYELADSLNFQVKSSDTFEKVDVKGGKGHGEQKQATAGGYGVKLVDAKFLLPGSGKDDEDERNGVNVVRDMVWRFVDLEEDEYAMEHADITIAFETEHGE